MGVTTAVEVCNIALLRIGDRQTIQDLNQNTAPAKACKPLYGPARDALLELFPWPFAEREVDLALVSGQTKGGWDYVYRLPVDCARAEYLFTGLANPPPELRAPFKLCRVNDTAGLPNVKGLATDEEDAHLVYTSSNDNPSFFSALFVDCLAWKLAADLALAIPSKNRLAQGLDQKYVRALMMAGASSLNQAQGHQPVDSEMIRIRSGTSEGT